jgi:hypothetical protein
VGNPPLRSSFGAIMTQNYNIFFRYSCGALGFLAGFDSEFGTPIVEFGFDPEFQPKEYTFGVATKVSERIAESGYELDCKMEIIPVYDFENHFFNGKEKPVIASR